MAGQDADYEERAAAEYEKARVVWRKARIWDARAYCWVTCWIGDLVYAKSDGPDPDILLDLAAHDFHPQNRGRRSKLEGRVEAVLQEMGQATAQQIAECLNEKRETVLKYIASRYGRFEKIGTDGNRSLFQLAEQPEP